MALKFEIVQGNLKVTNTNNNSIVLLYSKQNIGVIANLITELNSPVHLFSLPQGYTNIILSTTLDNCVDDLGLPFSVESFLIFCELNLGFNTPEAAGSILVTDDYSTLPLAAESLGKFYWCENTINSYLAGLYYSNGTTWETSPADEIIVVANYAALPLPSESLGKFYWCENSQGTKWLPGGLGGTYYSKGMYYSNGTSWSFLDVPYQATQSEVNLGLNDDKFVTPNTLSEWWTYQKGLIQTFLQKITFTLGALFTPQPTPTHERGRVYFDDLNDCLAYMDSISGTSVQIGQEMIMRVRNNTGATILNGAVVYVSGAIGQNSTIALAQSNAMPTSEIIGIATHDIANNTIGKVCVFGQVNDLDTSAFSDGNAVFLSSSVAGGLVVTPPISPNFVVAVGVVEHAHPTQGKILVRPQRALANNNSLGTSQSVSATQNAVKTYVDNALSASVSGTTNRIAKFTASGVIGNSQIYDNGSQVGIGASSTSARLDIRSQGALSTDIVLNVRNSTNTSDIFSLAGNGNAILSGSLRIISTPSAGNITRPDGMGAGFQYGNGVNTNYGEFRLKSDGGSDLARISNTGNFIVGGTTTTSSAIFQIDSATKGFLPPRMTNAQRLAISSPAVGLIVYCTDAVEGLYINKSTGWAFIV